MHSIFAVFAIAILSGTAIAAPAAPELSTIGASLPIAQLGLPTDASGIVLQHGGSAHKSIGPLPDDLDTVFLLCPSPNCQSCNVIDVVGLDDDVCFASPGNAAILSAATVQTNNVTLPFTPAVGTPNCAQLAGLPAPNMCFNLNAPAGTKFDTFALLV